MKRGQGKTAYQKILLAVKSRDCANFSELPKLFKNNLKNTNKQATRSKSVLADKLIGLHNSLLYPHFFLSLVSLLPINNVQHLVKKQKESNLRHIHDRNLNADLREFMCSWILRNGPHKNFSFI